VPLEVMEAYVLGLAREAYGLVDGLFWKCWV